MIDNTRPNYLAWGPPLFDCPRLFTGDLYKFSGFSIIIIIIIIIIINSSSSIHDKKIISLLVSN
jgi:hypothetical protein